MVWTFCSRSIADLLYSCLPGSANYNIVDTKESYWGHNNTFAWPEVPPVKRKHQEFIFIEIPMSALEITNRTPQHFAGRKTLSGRVFRDGFCGKLYNSHHLFSSCYCPCLEHQNEYILAFMTDSG